MIKVEYYPCGEPSPFPDNTKSEWEFETHQEFKNWVQGYVCVYCLIDFIDFTGRQPVTLEDWLEMGCGCEIGVTDGNSIINWNDKMVYSEEYIAKRENHIAIMVDAMERHG